ncbi:20164_t:CDS:2, partial [Dentiscutata erythropus]
TVTSITSSQQDIVDDNLASSLEFIEIIYKENIVTTISYKSGKIEHFPKYEKACDAEHESIKANQAEILYWSNFIIVLDKSLDELMVRDKVNIKKAKGQVYDFIIAQNPEFIDNQDNSSDDLPKTDVDEKTLPKIERKLSKEMRNPVINKLTSHFTDSPKLDKNYSIDTKSEHQTDSYLVLGSHCPLCRENHMSLNSKWWLDSRNKNTYYLYCTNLKELGILYDDVLKAYSSNLELIQELKTQCFTIPIPWNNALILPDKSIVVEA